MENAAWRDPELQEQREREKEREAKKGYFERGKEMNCG